MRYLYKHAGDRRRVLARSLTLLSLLMLLAGLAQAQALTVTPATLPDFGAVPVGSASLSQSFTVQGTGLTGPVTVTPAAGFEIRTGTDPFSCCVVTLSPASGSLASVTVQVRFAPAAAQAYSATLAVSGGGAAAQAVAVSGTGTAPVYPPTLSTSAVSAVTTTSATVGGTVSENGGGSVTARGLVWSAEANPTLEDSKLEIAGSEAAFSGTLTGLAQNTAFFVRAYATNAAGTSYGEQRTFTTQAVPLAAEPTAASQLTFAGVTRTSMRVLLSGGDGAKRLVLAREGAAVDALPSDATAYVSNAAFGQGQQVGTGNFVVLNGSASEVEITGLRAGATYHFASFEYNEATEPGGENYLTSAVGRGEQATPGLEAGLLFEENFAYAAGSALTANGWSAHSGTTAPVLVAAEGLSYPSYAGQGGRAARLEVNGQDVSRSFDKVERGSTVYASFVVRVSSAHPDGEYFFHLGPQSMGTNFRPRVFVRSASGGIQFGVSGSGGTSAAVWTTAREYGLNNDYLVVVRYDFDATGNTSRLYVNPTLTAEPAEALATAAETGTSPTDIGTVALRQGTNSPALTIDGIRVGTTYRAVVGSGDPTSVKNELPASAVRVYPNPATSALRIRVDGAGSGTSSLRLVDLLGRTVLSREVQSAAGRLEVDQDVARLPKGQYVLVVQTPQGLVRRHVVLK
ncbi:T9SS type A sorting domain-containing protein [Sabulibacter ruber]|uniref:T9SS type A sorting domain-containing protein n=1 Tax=Sabulibacter ruber TaxID=2811901 RepID=UPI001A96E5C8|nr:T9SS type A sorting domain-containing protein [Sabulibacter ruber]